MYITGKTNTSSAAACTFFSLLPVYKYLVSHSLTNSEVEIKEPDVDDWCAVNPVEGCDEETLSQAQERDLANYFAGNGSFDYQTFAARYWTHEITQNCDYKRSVYFYTHPNSTLFAGPMWDSGYAYNSPTARCLNDRIVLTDGWLPARYLEMYSRFLAKPEFLAYTIDVYRTHDVLGFTRNFTERVSALLPYLQWDWSLWVDAHSFECRPPLFRLEIDSENWGGWLASKTNDDIEVEFNSWKDYLHQRTTYLAQNYENVGTREDQKEIKGWGPLMIAFFSLWSVFLALVLVTIVVYYCRPADFKYTFIDM